jgi:hypothetical protein
MIDRDDREAGRALRQRQVEPHPDPASWEAYAAGELPPGEREALLDHAPLRPMCAHPARRRGYCGTRRAEAA